MRAGTDDDRQLQLFTILHIKKQSVHYRILRSYKDTLHGSIDSPAEYYNYSGNAWLPDALYVFGGTYTSKDATYGNSLNLNITGGTFNCANGQGSAVAIYDLGKVEQTMNVTVSANASLTTNATGRQAAQVLSLADIGVTSPATGYGVHSGNVNFNK